MKPLIPDDCGTEGTLRHKCLPSIYSWRTTAQRRTTVLFCALPLASCVSMARNWLSISKLLRIARSSWLPAKPRTLAKIRWTSWLYGLEGTIVIWPSATRWRATKLGRFETTELRLRSETSLAWWCFCPRPDAKREMAEDTNVEHCTAVRKTGLRVSQIKCSRQFYLSWPTIIRAQF